ncbi:hypothetical protein K9N68_37605 (plasmid) [Kovacikia minuta CCNUW1]|uniref:hypothetical protein n=1 Tax=Kovacikia minuta TaxID=2931930 RepID=UPI001CCACC7D|nr:hypothetical protein [Kovacikia minuta]UBF29930.1 hypothetical protein K9N68_37605 [Kovacikia minuta CCNUW1]
MGGFTIIKSMIFKSSFQSMTLQSIPLLFRITMSLTSHLKPGQPLHSWFEKNSNHALLDQLCYEHNSLLSRWKVDYPGEVNFPLVGMAMTYAVRDMIKPLKESIEGTVAWHGIQFLGLQSEARCFLEHPEKAILYVLLGLFDSVGRGRLDKFETLFGTPPKGNLLPVVKTESLFTLDTYSRLMQRTIQDVHTNLAKVKTLIRLHPEVFSNPSNYYVNPTFENSFLVGGADAQMIVNQTLIDIRTTCKRRPFTKENFYQQIAYVLLGHQSKITHLTWMYTRQQCLFSYEVENLFDVFRKQKSFQDLAESLYFDEADEDEYYG